MVRKHPQRKPSDKPCLVLCTTQIRELRSSRAACYETEAQPPGHLRFFQSKASGHSGSSFASCTSFMYPWASAWAAVVRSRHNVDSRGGRGGDLVPVRMEIEKNSPQPKNCQLLHENRTVRIVIAEVDSCDEAFAQQGSTSRVVMLAYLHSLHPPPPLRARSFPLLNSEHDAGPCGDAPRRLPCWGQVAPFERLAHIGGPGRPRPRPSTLPFLGDLTLFAQHPGPLRGPSLPLGS